jgi:hypothetical protein
MENMKSLADQLREELVKPAIKKGTIIQTDKPVKPDKKAKEKPIESAMLALIQAYDNSLNKSMVHVRFDEKTLRLMNQFKMAANIDISKLVAFAVKHLFDNYPELKQIIKQFIQNTEL